MLGIINGGVSYKSAKVISKLYRSYIGLHSKYCLQFWIPINLKDADMLEGVQRRSTSIEKSYLNDSKFKKLITRGKIEKVGYVFSQA